MLSTLLIATVAAASPDAIGIAITPLQVVQMPTEMAGYAEDRLANRLGERGFKVTTSADIQALLGLERQRQLLGCTEEACSTEIGAALGVPLLVVGRVSKIEERFDLDVRVIRQRDGVVIARESRGIEGLKRLGELMEAAGDSLARQLEPKTPFAWRLWVPLSLGVAAAAVGAVLWALAERDYFSWTTPRFQVPRTLVGLAEFDAELNRLNTQRVIGISAVGFGGALLATGILWNALAPSLPVSVVTAPAPGGALVSVGGRF
ncbi:MAG: hypothetical protein Q8L14_16880 [Myxococcales bacterium]|nr:hypothetical protein [Myxococcales bacterium]